MLPATVDTLYCCGEDVGVMLCDGEMLCDGDLESVIESDGVLVHDFDPLAVTLLDFEGGVEPETVIEVVADGEGLLDALAEGDSDAAAAGEGDSLAAALAEPELAAVADCVGSAEAEGVRVGEGSALAEADAKSAALREAEAEGEGEGEALAAALPLCAGEALAAALPLPLADDVAAALALADGEALLPLLEGEAVGESEPAALGEGEGVGSAQPAAAPSQEKVGGWTAKVKELGVAPPPTAPASATPVAEKLPAPSAATPLYAACAPAEMVSDTLYSAEEARRRAAGAPLPPPPLVPASRRRAPDVEQLTALCTMVALDAALTTTPPTLCVTLDEHAALSLVPGGSDDVTTVLSRA